MITLTRKEARSVLDALEAHADIGIRADKAIETLRARLSAPEPEPVVRWDSDGWGDLLVDSLPDGTLLYTASPQPEHEPVTNALRHAAQVIELYDDATMNDDYMLDSSDCASVLNALAEYHSRGHAVPPQREWQGLTHEEIEKIIDDYMGLVWTVSFAIEAKLKEKNRD